MRPAACSPRRTRTSSMRFSPGTPTLPPSPRAPRSLPAASSYLLRNHPRVISSCFRTATAPTASSPPCFDARVAASSDPAPDPTLTLGRRRLRPLPSTSCRYSRYAIGGLSTAPAVAVSARDRNNVKPTPLAFPALLLLASPALAQPQPPAGVLDFTGDSSGIAALVAFGL